jgi:major inositol transporter-like SP family MFS transporter
MSSQLDEDLPKPRLPYSVYGYTLVASFSSFVYGYNTGIIAPAILFIPRTIPLTSLETGAIVSLILVGAMLGSFFSGLIADAIGRRRTLAWNNILMLSAAVVAALGESSELLMMSRFVLGLGVGVASVVPGLYITEIAPSHVRGKLGAINQLLVYH